MLILNGILIFSGTLIFLAAEWNSAMAGTETWAKPMQALFQSVSARTAGFATADFSAATTVTDFAWLALMFIGGASGSTAGGIKLATVAVIFIAVLSEVRGKEMPEAFHRRIPTALVMRAITIATLFFLVHFTMTLILMAVEQHYGQAPSFSSIMFEVMSAQATVGVSTGITPELSIPGKYIIILTMFIGRLGPLTVAYALAQREHTTRYRYPEMRVHIG